MVLILCWECLSVSTGTDNRSARSGLLDRAFRVHVMSVSLLCGTELQADADKGSVCSVWSLERGKEV